MATPLSLHCGCHRVGTGARDAGYATIRGSKRPRFPDETLSCARQPHDSARSWLWLWLWLWGIFCNDAKAVEDAGSARLVGNNGMAERVPLALAPCPRRSSTSAYKTRRGQILAPTPVLPGMQKTSRRPSSNSGHTLDLTLESGSCRYRRRI